jgi:hypothetical protein
MARPNGSRADRTRRPTERALFSIRDEANYGIKREPSRQVTNIQSLQWEPFFQPNLTPPKISRT